jgi:flagellar biosynthetic protein FliS
MPDPMKRQRASAEYLAAKVESAGPAERVAMLLTGSLRAIREAVAHAQGRDFAKAHDAFVRAKSIVLHLLASIAPEDEGELAAHLRGLLQYAYRTLVEANLRKAPECAEAAARVLAPLADACAAACGHDGTSAPGPRPGSRVG